MPYEISHFNYSGKPDKNGWSQVYSFKPEDLQILESNGLLFAVVALKSKEGSERKTYGINTVLLGRQVFVKLQNSYFSTDFGLHKYINRLDLIKKITDELKYEYLSKHDFVLELSVIIVVGETAYVAACGGASVFIFRDGVYLPLVKSDENSSQTASGFFKQNDIYLLGTHAFFSGFAQGVVKAGLASGDLENFFESLGPQAAQVVNQSVLSGVAVKIDGNENFAAESDSFKDIENPSFTPKRAIEKDSLESMQNDLPVQKIPITERLPGLFKRVFEKKLYVSSEISPEIAGRQKKAASVGLILLIILAVSVFFGLKQKKDSDLKESYEGELKAAKHEIEEAENLISLNSERSRELFLDGREKVLGISSRGISAPELDELKEKIERNQGRILGEYTPAPEVFVDLGLLSEGFFGDEMSVSGGNLYVLDKNGKRIAEVSVSTKRAEIIAGPSKIDQANSMASYSDWVYIINSKGVFEVSKELKKVSDEAWPEGVLAQSFASNLYVLDKQASAIFRLPSSQNGFGQSSKWTSDDFDLGLSGSISMAIDGFVWVLTEDASVYKFSRGNLQNFKLALGGFDNFNPIDFFTSENDEGLYFLDREQGRVFVFDKEGKFVAQYVDEDIKNATKIAVSEKEKKLILLAEDKLLSIGLAHLN